MTKIKLTDVDEKEFQFRYKIIIDILFKYFNGYIDKPIEISIFYLFPSYENELAIKKYIVNTYIKEYVLFFSNIKNANIKEIKNDRFYSSDLKLKLINVLNDFFTKYEEHIYRIISIYQNDIKKTESIIGQGNKSIHRKPYSAKAIIKDFKSKLRNFKYGGIENGED